MRMMVWVLGAVLASAGHAQRAGLPPADTSAPASAPHRTRLILKDGSYQIVTGYKVIGDRVTFQSAERGGETEEIPLQLVDLPATRAWEQQHTDSGQRTALDPELAKEEADRAALTPELSTNPGMTLRLPAQESMLALDTFRGLPELVPLQQQQTDLNRETGHNIIRKALNPAASAHQILVLKGETADVQLHVADPVLYVRLDEDQPAGGDALTVDTHGASSANANQPRGEAEYAIVRVDVRQDARVLASFSTADLGIRHQPDVIETTTTDLSGGHWAKIVPREPLLFGEYCLVEVLGDNQLNLGAWDFGVHPTAPENRDAIKETAKRRSELEKRPE